ncbi:hypothetical protein [Streptomyces sp. CBMA123]|uniref:hypothetical protein n=1 Tax=Streptomyces sp. CBMA123 TaxID=1896313 RepID=UPI001661E889|nr:hypothetical protein [Streptomyces sp. CBMA123]MBD0691081.1 hypothetical protein [Streptomyces sp. CBMA123]
MGTRSKRNLSSAVRPQTRRRPGSRASLTPPHPQRQRQKTEFSRTAEQGRKSRRALESFLDHVVGDDLVRHLDAVEQPLTTLVRSGERVGVAGTQQPVDRDLEQSLQFGQGRFLAQGTPTKLPDQGLLKR